MTCGKQCKNPFSWNPNFHIYVTFITCIIITTHTLMTTHSLHTLQTLYATHYTLTTHTHYRLTKLLTTEFSYLGANHIVHTGNYNCDSSNIVYLLMCNKCNYGNYVGETSKKIRLRMNNNKKAFETATKVCQWLYITIRRTIPSMTFCVLY